VSLGAPGEAVGQVFGQEQPATGFRCGRQDDGIPNAEPVIGSEVGSRKHDFGRRLDRGEGVAPVEKGVGQIARAAVARYIEPVILPPAGAIGRWPVEPRASSRGP
jgi:hypothetical protein